MHKNVTILDKIISTSGQDSLRNALITQYEGNVPLDERAYWLIGTDGCHLCDLAWDSCQQAMMGSDSLVIKVELLDFYDEIVSALACHIPVLVKQKDLLAYPFGVLDIIS